MFETSLAEHLVFLLYSTLSGEKSDGSVLSLEVTLLKCVFFFFFKGPQFACTGQNRYLQDRA